MEKKEKSIKFNLVMNMLLTTSAFVFPLITFPYITRVLLPEGNGKIAFANSVINYFSMFAMLGIPTYGIRACAQVRDDKEQMSKTAQEIWMINGIMTLLAYAALAVALICVPRFKAERILLLVCSLSLFLNLIAMEWVYKALECYTYITLRSLAFKVLAVICMFLMVHTKEDYIKYAGITVLANTGYGVFNLFNLRKHIIFKRFKDYHFRRHLKPVFIFFAMSVAITIYSNLDITMLGFMRDNTEVGYYTTAFKLYSVILGFFTAFTNVMLPRMSSLLAEGDKGRFQSLITKSFSMMSAFSIPMIACSVLLAPKIIYMLSGSGYEGAILPMRIIMPTVLFVGVSQVLAVQVLLPMKKDKVLFVASILGACVSVLINFIFVPHTQSVGTAIVLFCSEVVVTIVYVLYTQWNKLFIIPWKVISFNIVCSLPCVPICYVCEKWITNNFLSIGLAIIVSLLYFLGVQLKFNTMIGAAIYRYFHK